ncbi:host attachment protein [Aliiruegeria lutimaris]|uniref:Protein required for attachment to host cells n=1 Tax=Aliiruegeria lutimaris TaxID=571298 RepID=A0A1G8S290_9RHOB|nr:host attachment protein [Aliiruegeria lutimaris]SDJ23358.1 Protein required for attachment to host cells [Aliiruegeria lutimaris]
MPSLQRLPKSATIIVCDARKALFLQNSGTAIHPSLKLLKTIEADATGEERDLKGNPPGRRPDSHGAAGPRGPKSAMEQPDFARLDEEAFATKIAGECARLFAADGSEGLVVAAPSRMLGALREAMVPKLRDSVLAEVPKTLTGQPIDKIAEHLVEAW